MNSSAINAPLHAVTCIQEGHLRAVGLASRAKLDVWGKLEEEPDRVGPLPLIGAKLTGGGVTLLKAELVVRVGV